jgi:sugar (pentulose or hexulose) kinase
MIFLGLDIGTATIKAAAYDPDAGRVSALASRPTPTDHPAPRLSEYNPAALWEAVCACLRAYHGTGLVRDRSEHKPEDCRSRDCRPG